MNRTQPFPLPFLPLKWRSSALWSSGIGLSSFPFIEPEIWESPLASHINPPASPVNHLIKIYIQICLPTLSKPAIFFCLLLQNPSKPSPYFCASPPPVHSSWDTNNFFSKLKLDHVASQLKSFLCPQSIQTKSELF